MLLEVDRDSCCTPFKNISGPHESMLLATTTDMNAKHHNSAGALNSFMRCVSCSKNPDYDFMGCTIPQKSIAHFSLNH